MKFIKDVDVGNKKKKKFLYEIPDEVINKEFGNLYIFQNQLLNEVDETQDWLDELMKKDDTTLVKLLD
jgi:hypothetical protein